MKVDYKFQIRVSALCCALPILASLWLNPTAAKAGTVRLEGAVALPNATAPKIAPADLETFRAGTQSANEEDESSLLSRIRQQTAARATSDKPQRNGHRVMASNQSGHPYRPLDAATPAKIEQDGQTYAVLSLEFSTTEAANSFNLPKVHVFKPLHALGRSLRAL